MPNRFLTESDVEEIKKLLWAGLPQGKVADRFLVTQGNISAIVLGKTWSYVAWPSGSGGAMPDTHKRMIAMTARDQRRSAKITGHRTLSPDLIAEVEKYAPEGYYGNNAEEEEKRKLKREEEDRKLAESAERSRKLREEAIAEEEEQKKKGPPPKKPLSLILSSVPEGAPTVEELSRKFPKSDFLRLAIESKNEALKAAIRIYANAGSTYPNNVAEAKVTQRNLLKTGSQFESSSESDLSAIEEYLK